MRALVLKARKAASAAFTVLLVVACTRTADAQNTGVGPFDRYVIESDALIESEGLVSFSLHRSGVLSKMSSVSFSIWIAGKITEQTPIRVSRAISTLKEMGKIATADIPQTADHGPSLHVYLYSQGGSVDAAIEIGTLLRGLGATVEVEKVSHCLSSCVLILAGGTARWMQGRIGIHRPYFETPTKSPTTAEVSAAMARMREKIVAYLSAMNVDRTLADDMMKVAPDKIRYITPADLNRYGLLERDPVSEEAAALKEASKYGLSRDEYMKRKVKIKEVCDSGWIVVGSSHADCVAEILSGKR